MWFQNRRAKWRKQARLSLLQDAWRLRCLGLNSSSPAGAAAAAAAAAAASMMPNEHQRQSPKPDHSTSSSPPIQSFGPGLPNSPIPKMGDMKMSNETSTNEDGESNANKAENFTLMHPAFQNVLQNKHRKYYANAIHGMEANADVLDKNYTNRDVRNCIANVLQSDFNRKIGAGGTERHHHRSDIAITGRLQNTASHHCESSDVSQDSSDSEEIDLTSNGIDFSNNNNNSNANSNHGKNKRKSEKSAMNNMNAY